MAKDDRPKVLTVGKSLSVVAWIEDLRGQVLLVRQTKGRRAWTLPGGKVKPGESLEAALNREIREETGLTLTEATLADVFDREQRDIVTLLYRARVENINRDQPRIMQPEEIEDIQFKGVLPSVATPTARFFWRRWHRWKWWKRLLLSMGQAHR
jgi:ADP-ribose pyrophosphatase YjhB (NUDIX family)